MVQASRRKYHYIYKTTCSVTNKFYIGMHSTDNLEDGYVGSGKLLWYSIRKHGKENHITEIMEYLPSRDELKLREAQIVNGELLENSQCMNIRLGGEGGWDDVNKSISMDKRLELCSLGGKAYKARIDSDPIFAKALHDKKSETMKRLYKEGQTQFIMDKTGTKHSEQTKLLMSEKAKERVGNKNSQFGTCWIHHPELIENKKIKIVELEIFLVDGWFRGRRIKK